MNKILIIMSVIVLLMTIYLRVIEQTSPVVASLVSVLMIANILFCIRRMKKNKTTES
ncbi:hypothetical protein [Alkalihalobacterium bogoriense]|uniref:hypothetical protein n=1 Tax=Alkalihalobacterium bogoriense TaxID=246272 RepID=UPI000AA2B9CE|nr:hypothetical protein [Alkalihalobacterium bogoriense]